MSCFKSHIALHWFQIATSKASVFESRWFYHFAAAMFPRRDPELICVLTQHKPAIFPASAAELAPSQQHFSHLMRDGTIDIQSWNDDGMVLEFDMQNVEPCIVNSLRRCILSEVPSMAPETVFMMQNTTIFTDDMIGSRVGLVPFRADPRRYRFPPAGRKVDHPDFGVMFEITTVPQKVPPAQRGALKNPPVKPVSVCSSDFKWIPHPSHPKSMTDKHIRPVNDDILLVTLHPAQELSFRVWVVKGIGKDHAKFSPVATATFRPKPRLSLSREVRGEEAIRLKQCFPKGVIDLEKDAPGDHRAVVKDSRLYSGGRQIFDDASLNDAVQIGFLENQYIFSVESVGALHSSVLVVEAFKILRNRCEFFALSIPHHRLSAATIKVEENP